MHRPTKVSRRSLALSAHRFTFMTGGYGCKLMKVHVERIQSQIFAPPQAKHFQRTIRSKPTHLSTHLPFEFLCCSRVTRYLNNCHRSPFDTIYHQFAPHPLSGALIFSLSGITFSLFPPVKAAGIFIEPLIGLGERGATPGWPMRVAYKNAVFPTALHQHKYCRFLYQRGMSSLFRRGKNSNAFLKRFPDIA